MKTLVLSEVFPPKTGGSGRWFFELYSRMPRKQYFIAAGNASKANEFDEKCGLSITRWKLSMTTWNLSKFSGLLKYISLYYRLYSFIKREKINRLHCARAIPEGFLGLLFLKTIKTPYFCYVHGEEIEIYRKSRELAYLSKMVYSNASFIIVNSKNTCRLLIDFSGVPSEKVRLLYPGVDTSYFRPEPFNREIRGELGWNGRIVILSVGRLEKRKGQDHVILSIDKIRRNTPNILYAIVGDGEQREYLEKLTDERNIRDYVQFFGNIDDTTLRNCYQQCDVFVLANRDVDHDFEGFGMVLVEGQACGKPVLAGLSGGTRETMIPGLTGLVIDCSNVENITEALIGLIYDTEKREIMSRLGAEWVRRTFNWDIIAGQAEKYFLDKPLP